MLRNYLITTFRNLFRNKVNSFINLAGLAISIACCISIYVFVKHEKSFDSFHSKADRVYRIVVDDRNPNGVSHYGFLNFAAAKALRNDFPHLETVTQVYINNRAIVSLNETGGIRKVFEEKETTYADEFFLKTFDYKVLAGESNNLLSNPDEVVLTKQLADKFFGFGYESKYNELIGKTITINKNSYKISAILQDVPRNTNVAFKMLLPFKDFERKNTWISGNWKDTYSESYTFVTLPKGYNAKQFDAALVSFKDKYLDKETAKRHTYRPQPLLEVHSDETYGGTFYATPKILIIAFVCMGIIVLLTACINFINLATAQSLKRAKEVGIRKTLGGRKWQLLIQFMGETFLLILAASLIAIFLAQQFLNAFNNYLSFVVSLGLHIDSTIIYFLVGLIILITILAGYYPARVMAGYPAIRALKYSIAAKNTGFANAFSLRKVLVITQFAVSQLLIIGTIVVASQMDYFYSRDLGFRQHGILTVELPENDPKKLALFRDALMTQPQVEDVTFNSGPPTSASNGWGDFRRKNLPTAEKIGVERKFVDPHYIPTYGIKLVAGRNLNNFDKIALSDTTNRYNIVVNKKATAVLGFANAAEALGQTVVINEKEEGTIVGVTENFYNVSLQKEIEPCLLFYATNWVGMAGIKLNSEQATNTLPVIQQKWEEIYPDYVYKAMPLTDYFKYSAFYILEDIMYQAFKIFVVLSIFIGCLGLYGLVSFLSVQRQKEIGIRKVLGASVQGIVYLFSKEFMLLVLIAFLVAAPLGYVAMKSWLETFANPIDLSPLFFVIAFMVSLLVAALTVSFEAIKAAVANPVKSLRSE
jgi:ABC-type antimicrobial peptide transport system permease subunit